MFLVGNPLLLLMVLQMCVRDTFHFQNLTTLLTAYSVTASLQRVAETDDGVAQAGQRGFCARLRGAKNGYLHLYSSTAVFP